MTTKYLRVIGGIFLTKKPPRRRREGQKLPTKLAVVPSQVIQSYIDS